MIRLIVQLSCFALLAMVLGYPAATGAESPVDASSVIPAAGDDLFGPAWIPASRAFLPDGRPDWDTLGTTGTQSLVAGAMVPEHLEEAAGAPLDESWFSDDNVVRQIECAVANFIPRAELEPLPHRTLAEIARNAPDLMVGTVVSAELGFSLARPGTLFTVEVERALKPSGSGEPPGRVLVFYPGASFSVGGMAFCRQGWFWQRPPRVGDRLVVARYREWDGVGAPLMHARWWELPVILEGDGAVTAVPRQLSKDVAIEAGMSMEAYLAAEAGGR